MQSGKIRNIFIFISSLLLLFFIILSILLVVNKLYIGFEIKQERELPNKSINSNKPRPPERLTKKDGVEEDCIIALDEAMIRSPEGTDIPVKIQPEATLDTLEQRIEEMANGKNIMPICYPKGKKTEYTRAIITNDIAIELSDPNTSPTLPEGIQIKSRPSYSQNFIIVEAPDPFSAMAALPILQATEGVKNTYFQIAKKMMLDTNNIK